MGSNRILQLQRCVHVRIVCDTSPITQMREKKEYQLKLREQRRKTQMLASLQASTNKPHDTSPRNAMVVV